EVGHVSVRVNPDPLNAVWGPPGASSEALTFDSPTPLTLFALLALFAVVALSAAWALFAVAALVALSAVLAWATERLGAFLSISTSAIFFALPLLTPLFETGAAIAAPLRAATKATIATISAADGRPRVTSPMRTSLTN